MGTITDGLIAWYPLDDTAEIGKDISGNSYIQLPEQLLAGVDDKIGITVSAWGCEDVAASVWEHIFDFGDGQMGPYLFLTRGMRSVLTADEALWHTPNVNTAEEEPVTPEERTLSVENNVVELTLPAYSVNVIKMRRRGL